jgi:hypothetical protein
MLHGWADGRRGIPLLLDPLTGPGDDASARAAGDGATSPDAGGAASAPDAKVGPAQHDDSRAEPGQPAPPHEPWTPRMEVLVRRSRELIEGERISFANDFAVLKQESKEDQKSAGVLREQVTGLKEKLDKARIEPSDEELRKRRLAEQDERRRPGTVVSDRRRAAWERRLAAAEERYRSANVPYVAANQALMLQEDLIRVRAAAARAAARRHHEFALRRLATYLQQLVRTHRRGAELNDWLTEYRVMPDLPDWVRDPAPGESGVERILAGGSTSATVGSDERDEATGP